MEYLIAAVIAAAGYAGYRLVKGQKILPRLPGTPAGSTEAHITQADQVAQSGAAKAAAMSLYGYLKTHGADNSPSLSALVLAFQSMSNTDPLAVQLTGPMPTTGVFDVKTAAGLTIYTHDPIPPATPPAASPPPSPAETLNVAVPGAAATSSFTLIAYLKLHGNDKSANLQKLVQQFQLDWDTDPKAYQGPAGQLHGAAVPQTGIYDAATQHALQTFSLDPVPGP